MRDIAKRPYDLRLFVINGGCVERYRFDAVLYARTVAAAVDRAKLARKWFDERCHNGVYADVHFQWLVYDGYADAKGFRWFFDHRKSIAANVVDDNTATIPVLTSKTTYTVSVFFSRCRMNAKASGGPERSKDRKADRAHARALCVRFPAHQSPPGPKLGEHGGRSGYTLT